MKEREQDAPTTFQAIRKVAGASCSRFSECVFLQIFVRTSIFHLNSAYLPAGWTTTIAFLEFLFQLYLEQLHQLNLQFFQPYF